MRMRNIRYAVGIVLQVLGRSCFRSRLSATGCRAGHGRRFDLGDDFMCFDFPPGWPYLFFFDMSDFLICAHLANGSRRKSEKCFPLQPKLNQDSERREDTILIEIRYEGPGIAKEKNAKRLSSGKMLNITGAA